MLDPWISASSFLVALLSCLLVMPYYIKKAKQVGVTGQDIHKQGFPAVAESGGIVLMLAFLSGLFFFVPFLGQTLNEEVIGAAATVLLASFIGFFDDIFKTRWRIKAFTPLLGGVPLAVMRLGRTSIMTPFGPLNFEQLGLVGLFFFFAVILPLVVTASANVVNMFAGLNGLEAGSSLIIAVALLFLSLRWEKTIGHIILIPFLGALLAFMLYNRYPSRVFPGDVGTLGMGTVIACVAILADFERAVFIMLLPHTVNAVLFFIGKFKGKTPPRRAVMNPDGTIPCPTIWSLRCLILRFHPMKERSLVYSMWMIVAVFSVLGTLVYGL